MTPVISADANELHCTAAAAASPGAILSVSISSQAAGGAALSHRHGARASSTVLSRTQHRPRPFAGQYTVARRCEWRSRWRCPSLRRHRTFRRPLPLRGRRRRHLRAATCVGDHLPIAAERQHGPRTSACRSTRACRSRPCCPTRPPSSITTPLSRASAPRRSRTRRHAGHAHGRWHHGGDAASRPSWCRDPSCARHIHCLFGSLGGRVAVGAVNETRAVHVAPHQRRRRGRRPASRSGCRCCGLGGYPDHRRA